MRKGTKHIREVDTTLEKMKSKQFKEQELSIEKSRKEKYQKISQNLEILRMEDAKENEMAKKRTNRIAPDSKPNNQYSTRATDILNLPGSS